MKKITTLLGILLIMTAMATAQTKNEFSLKQAVDFGLKNAIDVKNALLDVQIQQQTNKEITAIALPQLSASGSFNDYIDIPVVLLPGEFFGGAPGTKKPVPLQTKYNATGGVDLRQILFDGQVFLGLKARKATIDFSNKMVEVTQERIKSNIYKVYYQLVIGKKQLSSLDANIERLEKLLHDTKEIFNNGFAERLDVDKVQVQLNNLQTEKLKVLDQLEAGNTGLKFLINMPQKEELVLTDTLSEDDLKSDLLAQAYNYNDRKEIQLLTIKAKLDGYSVKRYQRSKWPTLSSFASYSKNAQRQTFDLFDKGEWFTTSLVGLNLSIPIFEGNAKNARIQRAKYELQKTKNSIEQTNQLIDNDIAQAKIKTKTALLTIDNQRKNIQLAESVYNSTKKKYEQGLGSNQEIYTAQTELIVAQTNYYSALYDAIIAKVDYLQAAGKL